MAASTQTPFLETYLRALSSSSSKYVSINSNYQIPCLSPGSGCTSLQQQPTVFAGHTPFAHNSFHEVCSQQSDLQSHPSQHLMISQSSLVHQQSEVVSQQVHTMGATARASHDLYSTVPPNNCLARTSTGFYVSPFAKASAGSSILGVLSTERKAGSSSLTQALQQTAPQWQAMPIGGVQLAAGPNAPGLSQQRGLPSVHNMLEHSRPSQGIPIPSAAVASHGVQQWHHQRAACHMDCVQGGSPCSSYTAASNCDCVYGASPVDPVGSSVTSTTDFWNPAVANAPAGLQRSSLMSLSAGSRNGLAAMAGCRTSSGGRLSPLPAQAIVSSFSSHGGTAAQQQQLLLAMQAATPPARCSASGCQIVPGGCNTAHTVGPAPVRDGSMVRSSLSALQLQHLAAVGGVQKSMHPQSSMATVQQPGGATRDAFNKIADALRGSAAAADSRASFLEAGNPTARCTPEERAQKIARYKAKRDRRSFNHSVKYQCRKTLADSRPRIKGRFARDGEPGSVLPDETKAQKDQQKQQAARAQKQQEGQQQDMPNTTAGTAQPAVAAYSLPAPNGLTLQEAYYLAMRGGNSSSSSASWQQRMQRTPEQHLQQKLGPVPTGPNTAGDNNLQPFQSLRSSMQQVTLLEASSGAAAAWAVPLPAAAAAAADHINKAADQSLPQSTVSGSIMHASSASAEVTAAGDDDAADDFALVVAMLLQD